MLSDFHPKGKMLQQYGLYNEERGVANRAVIIVDKQGIVRFKKLYASAGDLNPRDILAEIGKL